MKKTLENFYKEIENKEKKLLSEKENFEKFLEEIIELEKKWLLEAEEEKYKSLYWERCFEELGKIYNKYGQPRSSFSQPSFSAGKNFTQDEIKKKILEYKRKKEYLKNYNFLIETIWNALNEYYIHSNRDSL